MPRRPDSHVVADIAVNRVMNICADCGWAAEIIHKDYGDDLLVQPSYHEVIDHNRIWIQVKGTRRIDKMWSKKFGYSMSVPVGNVVKWARSADLSIVVLWDVDKDFGLWCIPKSDLDEWHWRNLRSTRLRLRFDEHSIFNKAELQKVGWMARIGHYATLVMAARERDVTHVRLGSEIEVVKTAHKSWVPLIAYDFLKLLFVIGSESVDKAFVGSIRHAQARIDKATLQPGEDPEYMATILAVLVRVQRLSNGCGLPSALLEACTDVAVAFVRASRDRDSGIHLRKVMG